MILCIRKSQVTDKNLRTRNRGWEIERIKTQDTKVNYFTTLFMKEINIIIKCMFKYKSSKIHIISIMKTKSDESH